MSYWTMYNIPGPIPYCYCTPLVRPPIYFHSALQLPVQTV